MSSDIQTTGIPQKKLRSLINSVRERIKKDSVLKDMFKEHGVDLSEVDLIPMAFAKMDVSATTAHGIIYFNIDLLEDKDFEKDDHYMIHEITHFLQQTTGTKPTKGSDDGDYLDNKYEVEGFQNQVKYLAETRDEEEAEDYVDQVLDHHDVKNNKREDKKEELMDAIASRIAAFKRLKAASFAG